MAANPLERPALSVPLNHDMATYELHACGRLVFDGSCYDLELADHARSWSMTEPAGRHAFANNAQCEPMEDYACGTNSVRICASQDRPAPIPKLPYLLIGFFTFDSGTG